MTTADTQDITKISPLAQDFAPGPRYHLKISQSSRIYCKHYTKCKIIKYTLKFIMYPEIISNGYAFNGLDQGFINCIAIYPPWHCFCLSLKSKIALIHSSISWTYSPFPFSVSFRPSTLLCTSIPRMQIKTNKNQLGVTNCVTSSIYWHIVLISNLIACLFFLIYSWFGLLTNCQLSF